MIQIIKILLGKLTQDPNTFSIVEGYDISFSKGFPFIPHFKRFFL